MHMFYLTGVNYIKTNTYLIYEVVAVMRNPSLMLLHNCSTVLQYHCIAKLLLSPNTTGQISFLRNCSNIILIYYILVYSTSI